MMRILGTLIVSNDVGKAQFGHVPQGSAKLGIR